MYRIFLREKNLSSDNAELLSSEFETLKPVLNTVKKIFRSEEYKKKYDVVIRFSEQ